MSNMYTLYTVKGVLLYCYIIIFKFNVDKVLLYIINKFHITNLLMSLQVRWKIPHDIPFANETPSDNDKLIMINYRGLSGK